MYFDKRMWFLITHNLFYVFSVYAQCWHLIAPIPCYCVSGNIRVSLLRSFFSVLILFITIFVIVEGQVVKTDTNNILIRALQLNKHKSEAKDVSCKTPGESSRGKRFDTLCLYLPVNKPSLLFIIYFFPLFVSWRQCFNRLKVQFWDDACICTGSC